MKKNILILIILTFISKNILGDVKAGEIKLMEGERYYLGDGNEPDYKKARKIFNGIVKNPYTNEKFRAKAQYYLANMYNFGQGVRINDQLATALYEEALLNLDNKSDMYANTLLALALQYLYGSNRDLSKARGFLQNIIADQHARESIVSEAQIHLARINSAN
jgi:hypothetical protein